MEFENMTEEQIKLETLGYVQYKQRLSKVFEYNTPALISMIEHRKKILNKYKDSKERTVKRIIGMGYTEDILFPVDHDGVVIDADDVFAAFYYSGYLLGAEQDKKEKEILWILLTNDPYIPIIPVVYIQPLSIKDRMKKRERNDFIAVLQKICPNLKYPLCELEQFTELIESEYSVKGRIEKNFLLQQLQSVKSQVGLFDPYTLTWEIGSKTEAILKEYGYRVAD